jgi:hypothetical protein
MGSVYGVAPDTLFLDHATFYWGQKAGKPRSYSVVDNLIFICGNSQRETYNILR